MEAVITACILRPSSFAPPAILHRSTPFAPVDVNVGADRRSHSNAERSTNLFGAANSPLLSGGASHAASDTRCREEQRD